MTALVPLRPRIADVRQPDPVGVLRDYYGGRSTSGTSPRLHALRRPLETAAAAVAVSRLPVLDAVLTTAPEGRVLHRVLTGRGVAGLSIASTGAAVLEVPRSEADLLQWRRRRSVRPKVERVLAAGHATTLLEDPEERQRWLALAAVRERTHPDPRYRNDSPQNEHLLDRRTWLGVHDGAGRPQALAVGAVDGAWMALEYFRAVAGGVVSSEARFLLLLQLLDHARRAGVRHVVANEAPASLTSGLLHFQRTTGWTIARVRVRVTRASSGPASAGARPARSAARSR